MNEKYYFVTLVITEDRLLEKTGCPSYWEVSNRFYNAVCTGSPLSYLYLLRNDVNFGKPYKLLNFHEISAQERNDWIDNYGVTPL